MKRETKYTNSTCTNHYKKKRSINRMECELKPFDSLDFV